MSLSGVHPIRHLVLGLALLGCHSPADAPPLLDGCLPEHDAIRTTAIAQLAAVQVNDASISVRANGTLICRLRFGTHRDQPAMRIESASKWLTAATLLAASDRKLLTMQTRTGSVWPSTQQATRDITVEQLLSHTSGLLWFSRCVGRETHTMRECAENILEGDSHFAPGAGFFYSAPPFTVAGALTEAVSGMGWHMAFEAWMIRPLGMHHTSYGSAGNPSLADGGITSSADDFDAFLAMILNDGFGPSGRVLSHEAIETMRRPRNVGVPIVASPRGNRLYGLGSWIDSVDASGVAVVLSSPGSRGFVPIVDFGRRMTFVFAVDADIGVVAPAVNAILAAARASLE